MVGLEKFRDAFADFTDNYVIIGGTACDIVMTNTVVRPRATHDIDIIIIVENMTDDFGKQFWNFIKEAGYRPQKRRDGVKYELYRFIDGGEGYPEMIELLSRHLDILGEPQGLKLEPLPISDDVSSLSAIIMDDDFYNFTIKHSEVTDGVRHASPIALIALKTRAYLNLLNDKRQGLHVNSRDIKKHRADVMKSLVIVGGEKIEAPHSIVSCVSEFVAEIRGDYDNLSPALAKSLDVEEVIVKQLLDILDELFIVEK